MEEITSEDRDLIAWFQSRTFPKTPYQVNRYIRTDDFAHMVELAIGHVKLGNPTSRAQLIELKTKLEQEEVSGFNAVL